MATAGEIVIDIRASTADFRRAMKDVGQRVGRAGAAMKQKLAKAAKVAAGALAAVVAAIGAVVKKQLALIDSTAKTSDQIGIATEQLAGLRHAAELTGAGADKLDAGLEVMSKRLGEAAQGSGEAASAIKAMGLDVDKLVRMSPDEAFKTIADAMQGMSSQAERNAAASDLFSRANQKLVNTLALGRKGLDEATKEAVQFGTAISRVEAAKVEAANDAFTRMSAALSGAAKQLTIALAPLIEAVVESLTDAIGEANGFRGAIASAMNVLVEGAAHGANTLRGLQVVFEGLKVIAMGFSAAFWIVLKGLAKGVTNFIDTVNGAVNVAIRGFNKIPGIDLELISSAQGNAIVKRISSIADQAVSNLRDAKSEMADTLMKPLPAEGIRQWAATVQKEASKAAEAVAAARRKQNAADEGKDNTKKEREKRQKELEVRQEHLDALYKINTEGFKRAREQTAAQMAILKDLNANALTGITNLVRQEYGAQQAIIMNSLGSVLSSVAQHNKKAFKLQQKAAIAKAIISGVEAAVHAWNAGMSTGGPWAPAVAAAYTAASLAKTGAQIAAIRSQSFGGGGGSSGGGGGGGAASAAAGAGGGGGGQQEPRREAMIQVQGDFFTGETVSRLAEEMGEFLSDGGRLGRVKVQRG